MLKKLQDIDKKTKIKFLILLIFSVVMMVFILNNYALILNKLNDAEAIRQYVLSKGFLGFISFVFIQALHVLLVIIPGDIFNFTGGYVFGIPIGFSLSELSCQGIDTLEINNSSPCYPKMFLVSPRG